MHFSSAKIHARCFVGCVRKIELVAGAPRLLFVQICPSCGEENPDKFRLRGFRGTALAPAPPPQEVRKTETIVFSDLKGATAMGQKLDSRALGGVVIRYFHEMRAALDRHGAL